MTHSLKIFVLLLAMLLGACTHNDGDIGPLFGSWSLDEVEGPLDLPEGKATVMEFQNNLVEFILSDGAYIPFQKRFGTWVREGDIMTFDFTHYSDGEKPGHGAFAAPEWLGFPENSIFTVYIERLDSGHFTFVYTLADGQTITYKFLRTW